MDAARGVIQRHFQLRLDGAFADRGRTRAGRMTTIVAPGKLMIAGEYAVLDGAPAIALAVDRGVQCTIQVDDCLRIDTPDGDDLRR